MVLLILRPKPNPPATDNAGKLRERTSPSRVRGKRSKRNNPSNPEHSVGEGKGGTAGREEEGGEEEGGQEIQANIEETEEGAGNGHQGLFFQN